MSAGPQQRFLSNMIAISWPTKGQWCSIGLSFGDSTVTASFGITYLGISIDISLGVAGVGNPAFWDFQTQGDTISDALFNQRIAYPPSELKFRGFGVRRFDRNTQTNWSVFFFKVTGSIIDMNYFAAGTGLHSALRAEMYDTDTFETLPWSITTNYVDGDPIAFLDGFHEAGDQRIRYDLDAKTIEPIS